MPLTPKQERFYSLLKGFVSEFGKPPILLELREWLEKNNWGEIRSLNSLTQYLQALEKAGKIRREGKKRGIIVLEAPNTISIPLLSNPVNCGVPTNFIEEETEEYITVSEKLVRKPGDTYAFRCSGDSMNKAGIDSGDIVLVEVTLDIQDGSIVIVSIDNLGTVKRIRIGQGAITLVPESTNPEHKPLYLHESDNFVVGGKVTHVLKS